MHKGGIAPRVLILAPLLLLIAVVAFACGEDVEVTRVVQETVVVTQPVDVQTVVVTSEPVRETVVVTQPAAVQTVVVTQAPVVVTATPMAMVEKQRVTLVYGEAPTNLGVWGSVDADGDSTSGPGCRIIPVHSVCQDFATDVLTYIDSTTFEVVPLSGTQSWEQIAPNRWRFELTPGVKFHNGEAWNAAAAAQGFDIEGSEAIGQASVSYTKAFVGEVVGDMTVDAVCENACPIFPTTAFLVGFQAPAWYDSSSSTEKVEKTVGFGPYVQTEYRRGLDITMEKYDDYVPNPKAPNDAMAPSIDEINIQWRSEALVRAAMVQVGEADWVFNLDLGHRDSVPVFSSGGAAETFVNVYDAIWHPELSKQKVRLALAHATNCDLLVEQFYDDYYQCQGTYAPPGTLGVTPRTLAQYEYDPDLARTLLAEAGYDSDNEIVINVFQGRFPRNTEVAEAQAGMWREVGINASAQVLETSRWLDVARTGCGNAWRAAFPDGNHGGRYCLDIPPGPACFCQPQSYQLNPSLETLDFGRATNRINCEDSTAKYCDPEIQPLIAPANAASMTDSPSRQDLMEELVDIAYDQAVIYTYFNAEVFYGSADNLDWSPRFDRRPRVNMWSFN